MRFPWRLWLACLVIGGCAAPGEIALTGPEAPPAPGEQRGLASWYGAPHHGRRTSSGEPFDMRGLTAAHRTLPFGTRVLVTDPASGRSVEVRINDRGPYVGGRVIDLSHEAARQLGALVAGVIPVTLRVLAPPDDPPPATTAMVTSASGP